MLEKIRSLIPATAREQYYTYAAAAIMLLSGLGYISQTLAALWIAAAGASITLVFALLHSLSPWRTALYGLLAAAAPLALWYSIGTGQDWTAALAFAGVLLGVTKAAANTAVTIIPMVAWSEPGGPVTYRAEWEDANLARDRVAADPDATAAERERADLRVHDAGSSGFTYHLPPELDR
ncbi:hypothetical protein GS462_11295 [Rhodococcus hoagii]|nr:hypothetical protein [Prescottella equi]MBM4650997.1 hypothetical protein [Prescottella equi]MBM4686656.1 hypothetical protein [Prescottella equi]